MGQPVTNPMPIVLLTRPAAQSKAFAAQILAMRPYAKIVVSPLVDIIRTEDQPDVSGVSGVIFTSRNAIVPAPNSGLTAWCVGDRTAQEALQAGWNARAAEGDAESLVSLIQAHAPEGRLVHLRGAISRGDIAKRLTASGIQTDEIEIYQQPLLPVSAQMASVLAGKTPVILPLFSPRTARHFADVAEVKAPLHIIAMSAAVAKEVEEIRYETCLIAPRPTAAAMIEAIGKVIVLE